MNEEFFLPLELVANYESSFCIQHVTKKRHANVTMLTALRGSKLVGYSDLIPQVQAPLGFGALYAKDPSCL